jgi:hypothetical protein
MDRFVVCATLSMLAWSPVIGMAQTKIASAQDYAKVMRASSEAFGGVSNSIAARSFAVAKTQVGNAREGFVAIQTFWAERKRDDAAGLAKGVVTQLDALDKLLSAEIVSRSDTLDVIKRIQEGCAACHNLYREGDNENGFRFKAGVPVLDSAP